MPFSFPASLADQVALRGDKVALVDGEISITYRELHRRSDLVAAGLAGAGVAPGERVVYIGHGRLEFFELLYGAAKLGAVITPLNWRVTDEEIAALIADTRARFVVVDDEFAALVPDGVRRLLTGADFGSWRERQEGGLVPCRAPSPDDVVVQSYTSGTTGLPKGVLLTNRMYESYIRICPTYGLDDRSVIGLPQPVHHVGGNATFSMGLTQGGTVVLFRAFRVDNALDLIERHRVTFLTLAPVMLTMLVRAQHEHPRDLSRWDAVMYGGQAISEAAIREIREILETRLFQAFGMTETCGAVTNLEPDEHTGGLALSAGRAFPWNEVGIFDPVTLEPCPDGEVGELWIRSVQCTPGYWNRPEATSALYAPGGWLRTGDVGYLDRAGYLFLTDRMTDKIVTGGENVYPREVESVLLQHPSVDDLVVVGGPDEKWGETVVAVVVPVAGGCLTADELLSWTQDRIAGFRRPRRVVFVDQLPRSAEGKILRRELRGSLWQGTRRIG
ncbi:AMP-binding protein [Pseudonocardia xishanensis]|uniref:Fatty acid--CoA ligase n=1 Tax=Pseudonocardia xishanensis TaxID=630995 RepID=A0ABP8RZ07_9PSEU